jgi:hypothetical protein
MLQVNEGYFTLDRSFSNRQILAKRLRKCVLMTKLKQIRYGSRKNSSSIWMLRYVLDLWMHRNNDPCITQIAGIFICAVYMLRFSPARKVIL